MDCDIPLTDFIKANNRISEFIISTPLVNYKNNIFLKKESLQKTGSFKWRGVLYATMCEFDKILHINLDSKFYIVTQSTGNHGIATIESVFLCRKYFTKIYPNFKNKWDRVFPIIFTNKSITKFKLEKMKASVKKFESIKSVNFIDSTSVNYSESTKKRKVFLKNNTGIYLEHGGKNILTGYGSIALEINNIIPKNKKLAIFVTVGAGGPIGIGLCFKKLRNIEFNIVQTRDFDAFIRSLKSGNLEYNNQERITISDGIAVDKPEQFALKVAKNIVDNTYTVNENKVIDLIRHNSLGNSTNITLAGFYQSNKEYFDYIVILDCEGN